jgi:hypothetical protein
VQHVERHVGLERAEHGRDVAADIDAGDAIARALGGIGTACNSQFEIFLVAWTLS